MGQNIGKGRVFSPFNRHHTDYSQSAFGIAVDQMKFQRILLPINGVFTAGVEVELKQVILYVANGDRTAFVIVDLNRMAVVENVEVTLAIIEDNVRQIFANRRR